MNYLQQTINSYQKNYKKYQSKKVGTEGDSLKLLEEFNKLTPGKDILEIGFGLGFDTKWFIENGYNYTGLDPVEKFNKALKKQLPSAKLIQKGVLAADFKDKSFDGIWAMASLLHLKDDDLKKVLEKCNKWLKPNGLLYISLKEGLGPLIQNDGRFFNLFSKDRFEQFYKELFILEKYSINSPKKHNLIQVNWLNFYLRKK